MRVSGVLVCLLVCAVTTAHAQTPTDLDELPEGASEQQLEASDQEPHPEEAAQSSECSECDSPPDVYLLERIEVRGNTRTSSGVVQRLVPFHAGEPLDPEDEQLEQTRYRILGTGYFDRVELSVERGSRRGAVLLVVNVHERNTVTLQELGIGVSEGANGERRVGNDVYVGATLSERNLFGTGALLEGSFILSLVQAGGRVRFSQPHFLDSPLSLTLSAFFLNAREIYGFDDVLFSPPPPPDDDYLRGETSYALVLYHRGGGSIGTAYALDAWTRFSASYQLEAVDVLRRPDAASRTYGFEVVPIDFHLQDRTSLVALVRLGLTHDDRDDPNLTLRGRYLDVRADLAYGLLLSSYDFVRAQLTWREWMLLPNWRHALRFSFFFGAALGDVPEFYRFYAADLSDLIPNRMLEINLDRRAPPNLLGTAIAEQRTGDLGARLDIEYGFQIAQIDSGLRAIWGFVDVGVYGLADTTNLDRIAPGYRISVPIDLTFDLGVRFDTEVGFFQLAISTVAGFVSL